MPDELVTSPAVAPAPTEGAPAPAPETPAQAQVPAPVAATAPEAPKATEPDLDSLLSNEDFVNRVLQHPKATQRITSVRQADIEQRAQARAAELVRQEQVRLATEAKAMLDRSQQESKDAELWRMVEDDPTSPLSQRLRPELEARKAARTAEAAKAEAAKELAPQLQHEIRYQQEAEFVQEVGGFLNEAGLSEDEMRVLDPRQKKYGELGAAWRKAWMKDVMKAVAQKEGGTLAAKLLKERLPVEVEAEVQQRLGKEREGQPSPAQLPQGAARGPFTRQELAQMPPEEYARHRDAIWQQLGKH